MKFTRTLFCVSCAIVLGLLPSSLVSKSNQESVLLIDDFSREDGRSSLDTAWRSFSDRVMGGVSQGQHRIRVIEGRKCIHLTGEVSLENNGGFIQAALPLNSGGEPLDVSSFQGIRLSVRGNNARYYIHLRSSASRRPWQYYAAEFTATEEWRTLDIPFASFKPESLRDALDPAQLVRIAIVGAWEEYTVDVAVSRLEFYR
jgi:hypothetical protein